MSTTHSSFDQYRPIALVTKLLVIEQLLHPAPTSTVSAPWHKFNLCPSSQQILATPLGAVGDNDKLIALWGQKVKGQGHSKKKWTVPAEAYRSTMFLKNPLKNCIVRHTGMHWEWDFPFLIFPLVSPGNWNGHVVRELLRGNGRKTHWTLPLTSTLCICRVTSRASNCAVNYYLDLPTVFFELVPCSMQFVYDIAAIVWMKNYEMWEFLWQRTGIWFEIR